LVVEIPVFSKVSKTALVVQDFFHQQYFKGMICSFLASALSFRERRAFFNLS